LALVTEGQSLCPLVIIFFILWIIFFLSNYSWVFFIARNFLAENRSTANALNIGQIANNAPHNTGESPLLHFTMHVIHVQFGDHNVTEQYNHFLLCGLVSTNALFVSSACHMVCIFYAFQYCTTSCRVLTAIHLFRH